jgi:hypothetical protein
MDRGQYRQAAEGVAVKKCGQPRWKLTAKFADPISRNGAAMNTITGPTGRSVSRPTIHRQSTSAADRGASGLSRQTAELGRRGAPFAPVGSTALEMPLEANRAEFMLFLVGDLIRREKWPRRSGSH